jgi:MFS transporter, DHA2 family, multidrug resistance protein
MKREINPWFIAVTVMLATFMEVLDTSVANVALPHIAGNLSSSNDEATWVLTSYLVANAVILPMSGWFSTLMGRKNFYLLCVAIFTVSSLLCGIAPSLGALIFFRILQGIGGGGLQPVSQAILVESFPKEKQGMALAIYGMGVVVAPVIGPTLGGWITDNYSWRWIFLINLPIGILSVLLTTALVSDPVYLIRKTIKDGLRVDYIGFALLALGLGFLEITLDEGQREDWFGSHFIIISAVIAISALVSVVLWELRQEQPIIDFRILKERNFAVATASMLMLGFVLYGSTTLLPLMLQTLFGYTAMSSGLVLSPGGLVICIGMPVVGFLLRKYQARWLIAFGVLVSSYGLFQMAGFSLDLDYRTAVISRMIQSLGLAFLFVPINATAFSSVAKERTNYASGLINLARNIGGSSGIAMATTILARRSQFHEQVLGSHSTTVDKGVGETIARTAAVLQAKGAGAIDALVQAEKMFYGNLQRQAAMLAFADAFWIMGVAFLAILPLLLIMKKTRPHSGPIAME